MQILHVGSGVERLPAWLPLQGYEVRLDIDPSCKPDIVASITDLGEIGPFIGLYSSHCLEHLYPHEVPVALAEFYRVLAPGGFVIALVPDLEDVRPTEDVVYQAPCGPITGLDMFYGFRPLLKERPYMAHHTGFVASTLRSALQQGGFSRVAVERVDASQLMGVAFK
jgi:SAM-dependent methyltransferase